MSHDQVDQLLKKLLKGIKNTQNVSIFFNVPTENDNIISCHQDVLDGMDSLCGAFQDQSTIPFTWFMGEIFATKNKAPQDRLVITDYNLLPDDEPLKRYYPPNFVSVGDYPLWANGKFIGWIGILSTDPSKPINWDQSKAFIADSIEPKMDALEDIYHKDFLPSKQ